MTNMNEIVEAIGTVVLGIAIVFGMATLCGTLIWILWPHVIPVVFPGAVENGTIIGDISWWNAVLFSWFMGSTFKPIYSNKKS